MKKEIVPAILAENKKQFLHDLAEVEDYRGKIQIDIEDGRFTHAKTVELCKMGCVMILPKLDLHLMIKSPERHIKEYMKLGPCNVTIHVEATKKAQDCIETIREHGSKAGIALNPETPLSRIKPYLDMVDQVLVMTVHPGRQGQKFLPSTMKKVRELRKMKPKLMIQVDGGINEKTIKLAKKAGANSFVVGSAILREKNIKSAILKLKKQVRS